MVSLSKRQNIFLIFVLSTIMWLTRGHHLASLAHLPDASWAIFFIVGFYFSSFAVIALFLAQSFLIDYLALTQMGIGESCFTIAYSFLLPAYLSLWFAGKWLSKHYLLNLTGLKNLVLSAVSGIIVCELISSGSYYFINVPGAASVGEFMGRLSLYLPHALVVTISYLMVATVAHLVIIAAVHKATPPSKINY
jgi:hypothetical protein